MRLKSYFAGSVDSALQQARHELGGEALLLDSRPASAEAKHLGAYEVVFALPEAAPPALANNGALTNGVAANAVKSRNSSSETKPASATAARFVDEFAELRREMERMRESALRSNSLATAPAILVDPEFARLYGYLTATDVSPDTAQDILLRCARQSVRDSDGRTSRQLLEMALWEQVESMCRTPAELGSASRPDGPKLVAVAGPPGAGKTTTLVKMAVQYGLRSRRSTLLLSLDNYRIGGAEQLRSYASILGVGFQHVETARALEAVLDEHRHKSWIFIDTPGLGSRETDVIQELSEIFRNCTQIDTHLVLSASMKSSDLRLTVERFSPLCAANLLFTHLDETEHYGGVLSTVAQCGKPISFLAAGQQIPEDLELVTPGRLVSLILRGREEDPARHRAGAAAGS